METKFQCRFSLQTGNRKSLRSCKLEVPSFGFREDGVRFQIDTMDPRLHFYYEIDCIS